MNTIFTGNPGSNQSEKIRNLIASSNEEKLMKSNFFQSFMKRKFSTREFAIFSVNYAYRIDATVNRIAAALSYADKDISQREFHHNLCDEVGGNHQETRDVWLNSVITKLSEGKLDLEKAKKMIPPLPLHQAYNQITLDLCRSGKAASVGVIMAQENHAYSQMIVIYEAFRKNYQHLYDDESHEFYDVCDYFFAHLGYTEKSHSEQAEIVAKISVSSDVEFQVFKNAFIQTNQLLKDLWEELHGEIES